MALPNQPWTTLYPAQQDTGANGEDQMPQLINDTFVGSDDGHRALAEHFLALRNKLDAVCKKVGDDSDLPSGSLADRITILEAVVPPPPHATSHQDGGADEINVGGLSGLLGDPQTPRIHAASHADGAGDEINVAGLSGLLADQQDPLPHASRHEDGGVDEINVGGLSGVLADPQDPAAHAADHQHGGGDEVATATPAADAIPKADGTGKLDAGWIPAAAPIAHAASHEDGGADEINVAGLSGELADDQNAKAVRETSGPTLLTLGSVADGEFLKRVGATIVSSPPGTASPLTTKGDLYSFDIDNQRLAVGDSGQMLIVDPTEATGLRWRNFPAFVEQTFQTLGTETPGDPVTFTLTYDPFGTERVDAPQEYDLLVFHEGSKMRYSASPSGRDYTFNPATREVTVAATGTADEYEIVYRTLDDIVIAAILSTFGTAAFGTDTYGPEAVVVPETSTYGTAAYGSDGYGAETPYGDTFGTAAYTSATYGAEAVFDDTFGSASYTSSTYGAEAVFDDTFGSASYTSSTYGSE